MAGENVAMRCLFYASNGHGLGHLIRTLAVARALKKRKPDINIMFVTNSEACQLAWREGYPVVKLLSRPANFMELEMAARDEIRTINRGIVQRLLAGFKPDIVVVDFFPLGSLNDLNSLHASPARKVLIARERKASAEAASHAGIIESLYDLVLIPHSESESAGRAPCNVTTRFTGAIMIRSRDEALPRDQARRRLGLVPQDFIVYVGFGGGGKSEYAAAQRWVLDTARDARQWTFALARPPLLRAEAAMPEQSNVREISYAPMAECWPAFDAAISTLGYNSTAELLHHGVPSVFIELEEGIDDWSRRARHIERADAGLPIKAFDTERLRASLDLMADPGRRQTLAANARNLIPVNGADLAAEAILQLR
jgi:UDP-N-acetylglucosamine--N-acetylmuramyl-(pentapeptide) pyrophosphoryl-undecaprenol N-acetylglucosamine transferase